jgi:hypothetical protein
MMKGEKEFKAFQPRFWAILKSFNFGSSLFWEYSKNIKEK